MGCRFARLGLIFALAVSVAGLARPAFAAEKIGVVLMHGKNSTNKPRSPIGRLQAALQDAGFVTVAPELPWSRDRQYADTVEGAFGELDRAVAELKDKGVGKVVIAGHSLGANIALAYGTQRSGLAGIIAIAPGHIPESADWRKSFADDVAKAKAMVAAGKGEEPADFSDRNQGKSSPITLRAKVYLSYFDPDGLAAMSHTAGGLSPNTPVLWIVEDSRKGQIAGRVTFDRIPDGGKKEYVVVDSSHNDAPEKSAGRIIEWLKRL